METSDPNPDPHLSQIETHWTMVFRAHRGDGAEVGVAQRVLMERYGGAVRRYLLGSLRDPDAADELAQEFALRFLRGDFRNADPGKGRFRDFVKRAVYHLMIDHHRRRQARPRALGDDVAEPAESGDGWDRDLDRQFTESWRGELMARAWEALARLQERTGQPYHAVLRLRVERPDLRSPQLAERLSESLGKAVTANWVRQSLHRARDVFVEFLLVEVRHSLDDPSDDRVEGELAELGLLDYCRPALRRREGTGPS